MTLSIILVHFKEKKILFDCIKSIKNNSPKYSYEIIVVDNDEIKVIEKELKTKFPEIKYIKAPGNLGYGKGNNLGVLNAQGEFVYILNPDTVVQKNSIDKLIKFLKVNKKVGIVAPTLYDEKGKMYPLQGTSELTPIKGIFGLSIINKLFPNNPISKKYWLKNIDRSKAFEVDVVPGSALMLTRKLFNKVGGFDKKFFLYFEETDFCRRVKRLGYKLFILPDAKILHYWAASTPPSDKIKKIFAESRFYYFRKNFGILNALLVEFFVNINKYNLAFFFILILGTFLRFYKIEENLIFNGEMGYDYTTIKSFIDTKSLPLIGPRTSHEWFFIGPIFYWLFAVLLPIFKYSVLLGAYFFAIVGVLSLFCANYYISKLFNKKVGLITTFLIAISPLWVALARDARYNALTAILFIPFYYYLTKSMEDRGKSLFGVGLLLGAMFSFFPSPILLLPGALVVLYLYREKIIKKNLWLGVLGLLLPNLTYIYFNLTHGFSILKNLFSWIPYRILGFVGLYPKNTVSTNVLKDNVIGLYTFFQTSFLNNSSWLTIVIFLVLLGYSFSFYKKGKELKMLLILFLVSYFGLFLHGSPPIHYYLVIYPIPLILMAHFLANLNQKYKYLSILFLLMIMIINLKFFFSDKWFYINSNKVSPDLYFVPYSLQQKVADFIIKDSDGKPFRLNRVGKFDYFDNNFSLNYQYLLKIKGAKINKDAQLGYTIYEDTSSLNSVNPFWIENLAIVKNEK